MAQRTWRCLVSIAVTSVLSRKSILFPAIEVVRPQRQPILRRAAGEIILGQIGPIDRRRGVVAHHDDAAAKTAPAQHFGRRKSGRAAADDDDLVGRIRLRRHGARLRLLALLRDEDAAAALFHRPAIDRAERRRPRRLAGAQIETGVMPRAAHASAGHEAFGERAMVVAAMGADGEYVAAAAHQQNFLVADVAQQLVVLEIAESDAFSQIRTARRGLLFSHGDVPPLARSPEKRRRTRKIDGSRPKRFRRPSEIYQFTVIAERKITSRRPLSLHRAANIGRGRAVKTLERPIEIGQVPKTDFERDPRNTSLGPPSVRQHAIRAHEPTSKDELRE